MSARELAVAFSLQMFVILAACRLVGLAARRLGQPQVVAEMVARWTGEDRRTAMAVGTLMNARGLMELIVINIGLQHGIIQPALFSVLVMASPVFELVYGRHARADRATTALPLLHTKGRRDP